MGVVIHKAELMLCVRMPVHKTEYFFLVFRNVFNLQTRKTARNVYKPKISRPLKHRLV